jgi:hypothetical protein
MRTQHTHDKHDPPVSINAIIMVSARGLGFIHLYEEELTTKLLINIMNKNMMPAVNRLYRQGEDWKLLWDNDSTHTSGDMQVWLRQGSTKVVAIPAHSPDLNWSENVWADLAPRVEKHNAKTVDELKRAILEEWSKTDIAKLKSASDGMVKRCQQIIESKGHKINH